MQHFIEDSQASVEEVLVINNACWIIGEVAQKVPEAIEKGERLMMTVKMIGEMMENDTLVRSMKINKELMSHLSKTVAIALGRLCIIDA